MQDRVRDDRMQGKPTPVDAPGPAGGRPRLIAIDGPAASGKSTVGYRVAELLNYVFFDTGVMYRAVTWAALARGVAVTDPSAVAALAETLDIDIAPPTPAQQDGRQSTVLVEGQDVTWAIRQPSIDQNVSLVSAYPRVRQALSAHQRRIGLRYASGAAERPGIVMVGRDIGTVVLPDAGLKIYMDASAEERARRRFRQMGEGGKTIPYAQILEDILRRDRLDSERDHSPLRAAEDAVIVDTTDLTPEQVVDTIMALVHG